MARIKDLIAALVTTGEGVEDILRLIAVAGYNGTSLQGAALAGELNWVSSQEHYALLKAMAAQGVEYKKLILTPMVSSQQTGTKNTMSVLTVAERAQKFLRALQIRDELHYPFTVIAAHAALYISTVDLEIIMALAREYQAQESDAQALPATLPLSSSSRIPPE